MIRIAGVIDETTVDGEGYRMAIFTQGCNHNCEGCHNPHTHDFNGGEEVTWEELYNSFKEKSYLDGLTLSGGDPMFQAKELLPLAKSVKALDKTLWIYTGFIFDEFIKFINKESCDKRITQDMIDLIEQADVVVDGPFILGKKTLSKSFVGSSNQRLVDVNKTLKTKKVVEYNGE